MLYTPEEIGERLAARVLQLRLSHDWRRETLAERAGVSASTIARFERTGRIALDNLLKLALALGCLDQFESLFTPPPATTLAELERRASTPKRKRGRT